jgi:hypothetical protein
MNLRCGKRDIQSHFRYNSSMSANTNPTLRKQLLGAAMGTLVALVGYGLYTVASPAVAAWLTNPVDASESIFTDADRATRQEEIVARTKAIAEKMLLHP